MSVFTTSTLKPSEPRRPVTKSCAPAMPSLNLESVETLGKRMNSFSFSMASNIAAKLARAGAPANPEPAAALVAEMADAGEDHGHVPLVGGVDDLRVAERPAGLDGRGGSRVRRGDETVREREEGLARDGRALQVEGPASPAFQTAILELSTAPSGPRRSRASARPCSRRWRSTSRACTTFHPKSIDVPFGRRRRAPGDNLELRAVAERCGPGPARERRPRRSAAPGGRPRQGPPGDHEAQILFFRNSASASGLNRGAMMTSVKISAMAAASAPSSVRLTMMIPPTAPAGRWRRLAPRPRRASPRWPRRRGWCA